MEQARETIYDSEIIELGEIKSLSRTVSDKLQEMILTGKIKPGTPLVQTDVARRFRISRVSARDALQELRITGLAVNVPSGGMIVNPITTKDVMNIGFVREAVEPKVAIEACKHLDEVGLQKMQTIINRQIKLSDDQEYLEFLNADWEFHKTLYSYADNELALAVIEKLWIRARQARGMVLVNKEWGGLWSKQSIEGHHKIINAIVQKDMDKLGEIIAFNIRKAEKEQLEWLQQII